MSLSSMLDRVRDRAPLVHSITNTVTINDCANIILAIGASPTMAQHIGEAAEIAALAQGLVLNMGNIAAADSMVAAGQAANAAGTPVILDPVGVSSSRLRQDTCRRLCHSIHLSVVRGNATEIRYMAEGVGNSSGVDAAAEDHIHEGNRLAFARMAAKLAASLDCTVSISGAIDIIADANHAYAIYGGCREMSRITGTGCMLTALMGAFLAANPDHITEAAVAAQAAMNAAGDLAKKKTDAVQGGTMTLRLHLIDAISLMDGAQLEELAHVEELPLRDI